MKYDIVIVGGSFAGLAAAMQLVRAQRSVAVLDSNRPRNRFAKASQGVFCLDGQSPQQIRLTALTQLKQYPTFQLLEQAAVGITGEDNDFKVSCENGETLATKKVIIASGIQDNLPAIPGIQTHWGKSVIHCPYCHGYELRNQQLGVLATSELAFHQAAMIPDWGATILFTQGQFMPEGKVLEHLTIRGVQMETSPIVEVVGDGEQISHVRLQDGRRIPLGGLYVGPKVSVESALVKQLDLDLADTPIGNIIKVDEFKQSSRNGIFVAGDLSNSMQNATFAISSGTLAGVACHRALVFG